MAYVTTNFSVPPLITATPLLAAAATISLTAGTHKFVWGGRVWNKDAATKTINFVEFLPGAITNTGTSTMQISLQDMDTANQARPDGTPDQSVTFADTAPTSATWYSTVAATGAPLGRSVTYGEKLCVVLEYSSFAGTTSFGVVPGLANTTSPGSSWTSSDTGSWAIGAALPNIILGFSDGTFGTLGHPGRCFPYSSIATVTTTTTATTPDEIALRFSLPYNCKVSGGWFTCAPASAGRDFEIALYEGTNTTPLASETFDAYHQSATTGRYMEAHFASEITLTANTVYYLTWKPLQAAVSSYYHYNVATANHWQAHGGGTEFYYADRVDNAASWSNVTTTRRPHAGIIVSAIDDGAGSGGSYVIGG
jgi:hypothetical protein